MRKKLLFPFNSLEFLTDIFKKISPRFCEALLLLNFSCFPWYKCIFFLFKHYLFIFSPSLFFFKRFDVSNHPQTWQQAQTTCRKMGGHLPIISTAMENTFLATQFTTVNKNNSFYKIGHLKLYLLSDFCLFHTIVA